MGVVSAPWRPDARRAHTSLPPRHGGAALLVGVGDGRWSAGEGRGRGVVEVVEQSPSPPPMLSCGRYILHRVCRFDTLAGVAIKYGVEVADVRRVNGLTTDLQMFANKTLRIPLPGRHPPAASHSPPSSSPSAATDRTREWTARRPPKNASLDPFMKPSRNTVSPSMSLLQGYYGLVPTPKEDPTNEGTEMVAYSKDQHRKARSISTGIPLVNGDAGWETYDAEKPIRRRQKAEQGLVLRPKSSSRPDINNSQHDLVANELMPSYGDGLLAIRKSSSTPEFQDSDNSIASLWLRSKWSLKPDAFSLPLPILLLDSIPKPLLDSIPKPIAAWRNKAARD